MPAFPSTTLPRTVLRRRILDDRSFERMEFARQNGGYAFQGCVLIAEDG